MAGKNTYLSNEERNVIWQSLYASGASGSYDEKPRIKLVVKKIMKKMDVMKIR